MIGDANLCGDADEISATYDEVKHPGLKAEVRDNARISIYYRRAVRRAAVFISYQCITT